MAIINALLAMASAALCWVPAFLHCELRSMLMLQKNPESKSVRNQRELEEMSIAKSRGW